MQISNRHMRQIHGEFKMKRLVPISFSFLFMALTSDAFARSARPSQIPNGRDAEAAPAEKTHMAESHRTIIRNRRWLRP